MTDVLKIAIERRTQLQNEVAKLDDFIRMAETLMSAPGEVQMPEMPGGMPQAAPEPAVRTAPRRAQEPEAAVESADVPRPSIIRRSANAAG